MSFDKNQTHIVVGYQGLSIDDPDKPALQIIQSILSGQGGRLFLELRDKASLAYSVSPIEMEGVGAGYFGGYIACSPEKAQKAIAMLRVEFSKLVETPMTSDELAKAKRYLVGRHDIDLQRNSAQASQILFEEIYGLDSEKSFHYEKVLDPVTSKDVQRVANRIFSPERSEVVVAVGAQDPFS